MSSSDEGEIIENGVDDLKATSLPHNSERNGVDSPDRNRTRQSSVDYDYDGTYRRSRSPRGYKRPRDNRGNGWERDQDRDRRREDDYYSKGSRRYDDRRSDPYQRQRVSYEDLDTPTSRDRDRRRGDGGRHRDGDRDHYFDKRARVRSRSPYRSNRQEFVRDSHYDYDGRDGSERLRYDDDDDDRASDNGGGVRAARTPVGEASRKSKEDAKYNKGRFPTRRDNPNNSSSRQRQEHHHQQQLQQQRSTPESEQDEQDFEEPKHVDEEAEIERRRKRREEILAKSSSATPLLLQAVGAVEKARAVSPAVATLDGLVKTQMDLDSPGSNLASPRSPGAQDGSFPVVDLLNEHSLMNMHNSVGADEDGPSAADYDPTADMKEDERRDGLLRHGQVVLHGEVHPVEVAEEPEQSKQSRQEAKKPIADDGNDDDNDDDFDMFAEDFDEDKYATKPDDAEPAIEVEAELAQENTKGGILEGDDKDGYYKVRIGEVLNGRYQIQSTLGRGMFSGVVRALDVVTKKPVAIKIMRNNDALRKGGYTEIAILEKLNAADPENRKHVVKFERSFDHRGHLCMAFENLCMNLREVLRKFGNNVGINLTATRAYAHQIFVALAHMRKCSIIHADLKPDNILVTENRNTLKICDLGTAIDRSDAATVHTNITPYLVSRFYRAPEVILGIPYDYSVDMWSIGCTLYELYTGKILFTGDSNNQMLKAIMEIRGRLTPKLFRRGQLSGQHFDEMGHFVSVERDKILNKTTVRTLSVIKPTRDLRARLQATSTGMSPAEQQDLDLFTDLLEHCLTLNPDKRIKPVDALRHPFFARPGTAARK